MKRYSRGAIVSLVLGFIGLWLSLPRAGRAPGLSILLGLAACGFGTIAIWTVQKRRGAFRGTGLAILGFCLGALGAFFSFAVFLGMLLQQPYLNHRPMQFGGQRQNPWQMQDTFEPPPLPDGPVAKFSSNLPIITVDTAGQAVFKDGSIPVRTAFFEVTNGRASLNAAPAFESAATIHTRGYTTLRLPKKSYTLHLTDGKGKQVKAPLLGLAEDDDWVLYAPYEDKTLIRDVLAFELANQTGHYAPHTRYIELFLNTSSRPLSMRDYAGIYVLVEKIKRGKNRVNIAKLTPEDREAPQIEGGYIVKRDHYDRSERHFFTQQSGPFFYVYPKANVITSEQTAWLRRYFTTFEAALYGADFKDPDKGYAAYLDVDAFIDAHWLNELGKNIDGFRYSAFLTKDRNGKIAAGPAWDWNRSFGNANYSGGWQTQGWYWTRLRPQEISWYQRLREDPAFERRCANRWLELRKNAFDPKRIKARIDELAALLEEAQQRNFKRWPVLGRQVTCNYYVGSSYRDEVEWLKNWIDRRIAWIDGHADSPASL